jgi:pSer/pThr/pTyr-binding forkhead associated (FHA) protein
MGDGYPKYGRTHANVFQLLSKLKDEFRRSPQDFRFPECPTLVWVVAGHALGQHWEQTSTYSSAFEPAEPRLFLVEKSQRKNPFALGITVGRVDTNDLVVQDDSVSRFHAFFRLEATTQLWHVTDAESKNGTWVNEVKLAPNERVALADGTRIRFGHAEFLLLMPASFRKLVTGQ